MPKGTLAWYLANTPLHLLIAGPEAVLIFFVLSGCVLALPVLRSPKYEWINYYASRTIRLGLPAAGAVLLASVLRVAAPLPSHPSSWVQAGQVDGFLWRNAFVASDLIAGNYAINNPMWSLRWEMIFSLALPIYVVLAVSANTRRRLVLLLGATVALGWAARAASDDTFVYLTVFMLGTIVACRLVRRPLEDLRDKALAGWGWFLLLLASTLVLILPWLIHWSPASPMAASILPAVPPLGALGIVWCALNWRPLRTVLSSGPFRIAGRYSFSLYLVHVPAIYLAIALLPHQPFHVVAPAAVGLAVLLCVVFYHLVEAPSHRFARYVGKNANRRFGAFIAELHPATEGRDAAHRSALPAPGDDATPPKPPA